MDDIMKRESFVDINDYSNDQSVIKAFEEYKKLFKNSKNKHEFEIWEFRIKPQVYLLSIKANGEEIHFESSFEKMEGNESTRALGFHYFITNYELNNEVEKIGISSYRHDRDSKKEPLVSISKRINYFRQWINDGHHKIDIASSLIIGQPYKRTELHHLFGGQEQGGISTPSLYPVILAFTGDRGEEHGYEDKWTEDGVFLYSGEGQEGDMEFNKGNLAIRDHETKGKDIHLFEYKKKGTGVVFYLGQMSYIGYQLKDKDAKGKERRVIIFELMPIDAGNEIEETRVFLEHKHSITDLSLDELRIKALNGSSFTTEGTTKERKNTYRERSQAVKLYALKRANGICEACGFEAPFITAKGEPFLEVHHTRRLSDGGPDHPEWVAAICPNCHRRAHYSHDSQFFNESIIKVVKDKENSAVRLSKV